MWIKFLEYAKRIYSLRSAQALLGWDQETMMPSGAGAHRAEILSQLSAQEHRLQTAPEFMQIMQDALLAIAHGTVGDVGDVGAVAVEGANFAEQNMYRQRCIEIMQKDCKKAASLPTALVQELSKVGSLCQQSWQLARASGEHSDYLKHLNALILLKKQEAQCLSGGTSSPYDALLNEYEPGMTQEKLDFLFGGLMPDLRELLQKVLQKQAGTAAVNPQNVCEGSGYTISEQRQQIYLEGLLNRIGFSLQKGCLHTSTHPFTESTTMHDVRLTTRYKQEDIGDALFSALHEGGHGLYEQGLNEEWAFTPIGQAVSLGIHESQSRFWENIVGRSLAFWQSEWDVLSEAFPEIAQAYTTPHNWYNHINIVKPDFIRVDADEVTYNFHVYIRYTIEKALFSEQLALQDVEQEWNSLYTQWLGITPPTAAKGYLQDVHWSAGLFGYFPTYTLGNIYSAQMANAYGLNQLTTELQAGHFSSVLAYLRTNIHTYGRLYSPEELLVKMTGKTADSSYFLKYLNSKYLGAV
jgi:carboxypeptidase Taq